MIENHISIVYSVLWTYRDAGMTFKPKSKSRTWFRDFCRNDLTSVKLSDYH
jgi:hypothetical protein